MKLRVDDVRLVEGREFLDLLVVQMITSILLRRVIIRMWPAPATLARPSARATAHGASRSRGMAPYPSLRVAPYRSRSRHRMPPPSPPSGPAPPRTPAPPTSLPP